MNEQADNYFFPGTNIPVRKVQDVIIEIMIEFDRICREHNLRYSLYGGTMLGAVRHQGFIPWDDDLDVFMPREDYDRFLAIVAEDLDPRFFISNHRTEEKSCLLFTKMRRNDSRMVQPGYVQSDIHHGMFLDVFPLDRIELNTAKGKRHLFLCNLLFLLVSSTDKSRCRYTSSRFHRLSRLSFYYLGKLIGRKRLFALTERVLRRFNERETEFRGDLTNGLPGDTIKKWSVSEQELQQYTQIEFEGRSFSVAENYAEMLQRGYGDYLTWPPPEDRVPAHATADICFPGNV